MQIHKKPESTEHFTETKEGCCWSGKELQTAVDSCYAEEGYSQCQETGLSPSVALPWCTPLTRCRLENKQHRLTHLMNSLPKQNLNKWSYCSHRSDCSASSSAWSPALDTSELPRTPSSRRPSAWPIQSRGSVGQVDTCCERRGL